MKASKTAQEKHTHTHKQEIPDREKTFRRNLEYLLKCCQDLQMPILNFSLPRDRNSAKYQIGCLPHQWYFVL